METTGTLDEALLRLHRSGPEFQGYLSNHGPMAVEAMVRRGHAPAVHRWLDDYATRLEDAPRPHAPLTDATWREALGDPSRLADWVAYFSRLTAERPWRDVLATWWPRLLPGIAGAATHPAIRTGHAVRALLTDGEDAPRVAELAYALGYWAARHVPLPVDVRPSGDAEPRDVLPALPRLADTHLMPLKGLALLPGTPGWPEAVASVAVPTRPADVPAALAALVEAATLHYGERGHGNPVMLVHAATAPNAVLRTLPALPEEQWIPSLTVAWAATAALTSLYSAGTPRPLPAAPGLTAEEVFAEAVAHGDAHVVKFADTALDVAAAAPDGDGRALAAALNAVRLIGQGED
ncbi:hypothetical protein GCM10010218_46390 [Streptomyces mashuensis]|uniref:DUF4243 domain-containing protein n=1 Tax=Streptomyces mashuensis TaxID=33904 RepID=A0A919EDX3_9ACTN|nr:questin oxidase family protein [Streptomyces mashuensis]GHF59562.1 hypothetical protein GCM10010218_46390 [Streptomyces mashuensis]